MKPVKEQLICDNNNYKTGMVYKTFYYTDPPPTYASLLNAFVCKNFSAFWLDIGACNSSVR